MDKEKKKPDSTPDIVREVYREFKTFKDDPKRAVWIKKRETAWKAVAENEQWTDGEKTEIIKFGQVPIVENKLNKGVQGSSAVATAQSPEIKAHPIGSDDLYVAELLKRGHDLVDEKNGLGGILYDFVEESKVGALGVIEAKHNPHIGALGMLEITEEDPIHYYFSSESRKHDFSDTHIIKAKLREKEYIKENYPHIEEEDLLFNMEDKMDEPSQSTGVTGEDNYTIDADAVEGDTQKGPKQIWEIEAWMLRHEREHTVLVADDQGIPRVEVFETMAKGYEDAIKAAKRYKESKDQKFDPSDYLFRRVQKRQHVIIIGKHIEVDEMNPYGSDADGRPITNIIFLPHNRTRSAYPTCPTFIAIDINRAKNKNLMQQMASASHSINAPIIEPDGKVKWEVGRGEASNPGTPGTRGKVAGDAPFQPFRLQSGGMDMHHHVTLDQKYDRAIEDQYDMPEVMQGKTPAGQERSAWRMIAALQDAAGNMSKPFIRKFEAALERLGKVNFAIMLKHWPRSKWEGLIDPEEMQTWTPDGEKEENPNAQQEQDERQKIAKKWMAALDRVSPKGGQGIRLIDIDVKVAAGSSLLTNRIAKFEMAIKLMEAGVYDAQAVLETIDDVNAKPVLKRMQKQAEMAQMMGGKK